MLIKTNGPQFSLPKTGIANKMSLPFISSQFIRDNVRH
ncbi:hypothetical protein RDI58_009969 [Solanum bulbocastanum]|uniref:Uncharacterized protein n=1 Tax=Solanum bulbocastanum TaxID=147425 RepID=A0AAN8YJ00_SOLBU